MAGSNASAREFTVTDGSDGRSRFRAAITTFLVIVVILLVFGFFAARTEMFHTWVEEYLKKRTGLNISIERTKIGWPYDLVIEGLKSESDKDGTLAGISADEIRVGLAASLTVKVKINGCALSMMRIEDGSWRPAFFARLGQLREVEEIAGLTESFRKRTSLEIVRSSILWFDSDGSRIMGAEDLDFAMEPLVLKSSRRMYYCRLSVYNVVREDGGRTRDLRREWFFTEDNQFIEIGYEEDEGKALPGHSLWSGNGGEDG